MKRIILTESQYKRLVRQDLNEQYKKIVYLNMRDAYDVNPEMLRVLEYLNYKFDSLYNKPLYVLKIEDGKVYIDTSKYTSEEIDYVKNQAKEYLSRNRNPNDSLLSNDFGFDSGIDSDYNWSEDEKVVDIEDSSKCYCYDLSTDEQIKYNCNSNLPAECGGKSEDINITIDDDDVVIINNDDENTAEVEYGEIEDISYCDYGVNNKGQKRKFVPPPNMDIKFYQDILKSIGANVTCQKMLFFYAWRTGESSKSSYNPFATTQPNEVNEGCYYNCLKSGVGYTPVGCRECPSGTSPGVRNYKTYESGLKNTVKTLTNGKYNNVVTKLKNDNITAEEIASEKSELKTWGTGGLVLDILKYNEKIKPTPISKYGDDPQYVLPDDEEILDCENCLTKIQTKSYDENVNDENVKDFRWWINQDSTRLKSVTDKLKECCETKSDPTISTSYNKKNEHTLIAFSVVGNEWVNSGKPKREFEILDIDETNLIKPSSNYGTGRDYGWREPIPSLCRKGKIRYCKKHWHGGEDYPYPIGTEIYVFQPGNVVEKNRGILKIKHDDGSKTGYFHCDQFFVEKGDRIEPGTLIGTVGNKGSVTGPHLHFEYSPDGIKNSNPKDIEDKYIRFKKKN